MVELAQRLGKDESYVARLIRLATVSPTIVRGGHQRPAQSDAHANQAHQEPSGDLGGAGEDVPGEVTGTATGQQLQIKICDCGLLHLLLPFFSIIEVYYALTKGRD